MQRGHALSLILKVKVSELRNGLFLDDKLAQSGVEDGMRCSFETKIRQYEFECEISVSPLFSNY